MAKMRVHELAKEIDKPNKEVMTFLQEKGIDVKSVSSSIEDDAIALVKKHFGKNEEVKEEKPMAKAGDTAGEAPKKKKTIIVVSNPHNSKIPGQNPGKQGGEKKTQKQPPKQGNANNNQRQSAPARQEKPAPYRPIKPLTPPSPTPPVTMIPASNYTPKKQTVKPAEPKNTEVVEEVKAVKTEVAENTAVNNKPAREEGQRRENGKQENSRPDNSRQDRPRNNDSQRRPDGRKDNRNDNRRPEGQNRKPFENNQGDRRNNGSGQGGNRSFGNNDRPNRGNGGADNKFRKPAPAKSFVPESPVKDQEKHRDEEKRRIGQERDKRSKKDLIYEEDDIKMSGKNKAGKFIKPEKKVEVQEEQIKVIVVPESLTIKELADKMKLQPSAIIKKLFLQGQIVTVNSELSFEEAENIAIDYDIICEKEVKVDVIEELLKEEEENTEDMTKRPPVICVMGHVDHGKTSLLDAIRKTNVTDKEGQESHSISVRIPLT